MCLVGSDSGAAGGPPSCAYHEIALSERREPRVASLAARVAQAEPPLIGRVPVPIAAGEITSRHCR